MHITLWVVTPQYISPFKSFNTVLNGSGVARCRKLLFFNENLSSGHLAPSAFVRLLECPVLEHESKHWKGSKIQSLLSKAATFRSCSITCSEERDPISWPLHSFRTRSPDAETKQLSAIARTYLPMGLWPMFIWVINPFQKAPCFAFLSCLVFAVTIFGVQTAAGLHTPPRCPHIGSGR